MFTHLKDKTVLVTSSARQAADEILRLKNAGAHPIHIPLIEISKPSDNFAALDAAIENLDLYSWIVFTSKNGVAAFFERLADRALPKARMAAVGPQTAEKIAEHGLRVSLVPERHDADGLLLEMLPHVSQTDRVLWPRAREGRDVLLNGLQSAGVRVDVAEAYQSIMPPDIDRDRLIAIVEKNEADAALFSSPSAVKNFCKIVGEECAKNFASCVQIIPIGPATEAEVKKSLIPRPA